MAGEAPLIKVLFGDKTKEMPVEGRLPAAKGRMGGVDG